MPQSECGAGHTGYRIFSDPSPGGSQDTGGAFRSRVQRHGVRHRSIGAGHNLTEKNLLDAAKLGGLPMPSIAIVKANAGHGEYGGISFVFSKDTIDP